MMTAAMGLDHHLSAVSLGQIASHLGAFPQCAPLEAVGPNLRAAKVTLSRAEPKDPRKVGFRGKLTSASGAPIIGEVVNITIGKRVITMPTNQQGAFKRAFSKKLFRGQKKVTVVARLAQLPDGPSQQMTLRIS